MNFRCFRPHSDPTYSIINLNNATNQDSAQKATETSFRNSERVEFVKTAVTGAGFGEGEVEENSRFQSDSVLYVHFVPSIVFEIDRWYAQ